MYCIFLQGNEGRERTVTDVCFSFSLFLVCSLGLTFRAHRPPVPTNRPSFSSSSSTRNTTQRGGAGGGSFSQPSATSSSSSSSPSAVPPAVPQTKYLCEQHSGLFLSTGEVLRSPLTARLISGLPPSLLLSNDEGDIFLLLSATAKPYRVFKRPTNLLPASLLSVVPSSQPLHKHQDYGAIYDGGGSGEVSVGEGGGGGGRGGLGEGAKKDRKTRGGGGGAAGAVGGVVGRAMANALSVWGGDEQGKMVGEEGDQHSMAASAQQVPISLSSLSSFLAPLFSRA